MSKERKKCKAVVMVCNKVTEKGRVYPSAVIQKALDRFPEKGVKYVTCCAGDGRVCAKDVAGTTDLKLKGDEVLADITLLDTPRGLEVQDLVDKGQASFCLRGLGDIDDKGVVTDFKFHSVNVTERKSK